MTLPRNPYSQPSGPQFGNPYGPGSTRSSFGGWGGQGHPFGSQGFGQSYPPSVQLGPQAGGPYGPGGFGPSGQFPPPRPPRKSGPPAALVATVVIAGVVLAGMLVYAFLPRGGPDQVGPRYLNEDYEVPAVTSSPPDLEIPTTEEELVALLEDNPVYQETMAVPVRCDLALEDEPLGLSDDELEARMGEFVGCLTRAWGPLLEEAGFVAYQPRLTVYPAGGTVQTQCGTAESMNAFFCGGDQNLYLAPDIARVLPPETASARVLYELIIAHEYGHAMQGRIGVFASSKIVEVQAPEDIALEFSRRVELQADCFAGTGMLSLAESLQLTDADVEDLSAISFDIGDDVLRERFGGDPTEVGNHGTGDNRVLWVERGLSDPAMATCNTWTVPSSEVE
ncbi:neutral zinc metallopeptidase [Tessaracoccus sp. OS52]|uniref:neutral zinc metallopeptidase n=1 Tax=Tessaracoccus sp. OS52 TaxID=2886691 RepID=UPI001D11AAF0|nr:neutral zinc metallopeptidase [Tessaracoccus sp. OS52]